MAHTKEILVVGATGHLGTLITRSLLAKPGVRVRCLVRPDSRAKLGELEQAGVTVIEGGLDAGPTTLAEACAGVYAVVSAVQGGPDTIIEGQLALLRAARDAGVRRFLPSDYSFDLFGLTDGDNINSDWRRTFARRAEDVRGNVEIVHILNGCFLDRGVLFGFAGIVDLGSGRAFVWGDGKQAMDFTTYADTAAYTAEAAIDDSKLPERFYVAGDTVDFHGLVAAYQAGSGRTLEVESLGSLADMNAELGKRRATSPRDFFAWLPLMYYRAMLDGKGKLGPLENHRYPHIRPITIAEYVQREGL